MVHLDDDLTGPHELDPDESRSRGLLRGDPSGLYPCIVLGAWIEPSEIAAFEPALRPGQFILQHQYGGLSCLSRTLWGLVLPIAACTTARVREDVTRLAETYTGQPFSDEDPTLDDILRVRDDMHAVGPLDCARDFRDLHEAFLTFDVREAWEWLRQHFRMATVIEDPADGEPVEVSETERLPWQRWEDWLEWMHAVDPTRLYGAGFHGALLYANSD